MVAWGMGFHIWVGDIFLNQWPCPLLVGWEIDWLIDWLIDLYIV